MKHATFTLVFCLFLAGAAGAVHAQFQAGSFELLKLAERGRNEHIDEMNRQQEAENRMRAREEHLARQNMSIRKASAKWDRATKTTVLTYLATVEKELKDTPLDDVYLSSILIVASDMVKTSKTVSDVNDFATKMQEFWKKELEKTPRPPLKQRNEVYIAFTNKIVQNLPRTKASDTKAKTQ